MKRWIMPLTIVLVIVTSIFAYAYEREQMGIGELTTDTIKNSAGTTVIDMKNGTMQAGGYVFTIHTSTIGGRLRHIWSD